MKAVLRRFSEASTGIPDEGSSGDEHSADNFMDFDDDEESHSFVPRSSQGMPIAKGFLDFRLHSTSFLSRKPPVNNTDMAVRRSERSRFKLPGFYSSKARQPRNADRERSSSLFAAALHLKVAFFDAGKSRGEPRGDSCPPPMSPRPAPCLLSGDRSPPFASCKPLEGKQANSSGKMRRPPLSKRRNTSIEEDCEEDGPLLA